MQKKTCLFYKKKLYELLKMYTIIKRCIPINRKQGYYPDYFYINTLLLCRTELQTIDADRYVEEYNREYNTKFKLYSTWCRCYDCASARYIFL